MLNKAGFLLKFLLVIATVILSGCETIKGAGRDITNAGEAIEEAMK